MKDGKFETQAEIYQALLDGKKIRQDGHYETVFMKGGNLNTKRHWNFNLPNDWSIYEEPKPKVTKTFECQRNITGQELVSQITLRQHFAAMAMQGFLSNPNMMKPIGELMVKSGEEAPTFYAQMAIEQADALIEALNAEKEGEK